MGWNTIIYATLLTLTPILAIQGGYYISELAELYQNGLQNIMNVIEYLFHGLAPFTVANLTETTQDEYDFIIVGSGSAGSVIANRLSEIGNWKVLLLEAGTTESSLAQYPILAHMLYFTDYNWNYVMEPQDNICLAMEHQRCTWPRGKVLGGSTVINYMAYTRGNPEDYDRWAALGNSGWSYNDVLPYFLKSEDSKLKHANDYYHSVGGYQSVEDSFATEIGSAFIKAGQELGYKFTDINSPEQIGFSTFQTTTKLGRRHSTANAFLKPILHRKNLHIVTGAKVTKILIDPYTNKAYGVTFNKNEKKISVKATKEVIVSAGTINSPQLLMLSGVGPRKHLEKLGIPTLSDLPVGETLYDHIAFFGIDFTANFTAESIPDLFSSAELSRWYTTGEGAIRKHVGSDAIAFINSHSIAETYPDLEIVFSLETLQADYGVIGRRTIGVSDAYYQKMYRDLEGISMVTMLPILLHPKSKGHLKLKSSDPYDHPLLYGNYLRENQDIQTLIAGIRFIIKLSEAEAFKKFNVRLSTKPLVGCEHMPFNSNEYWYCALQLLTTTIHHQIATCKMGPIGDPTAVVNPELKVYGIENLRVADASIMPVPVSGHTSAPAIMIGEVVSDLIKHDWGVV